MAGEPYVDFVRRRILEPLGMTATLVASPDPVTRAWPPATRAGCWEPRAAPFNDSAASPPRAT